MDGKLSSVQAILSILDQFAAHSGLKVSLQKTSFVSCGIPQDQVDLIAQTCHLSVASLPVRYLGIPLLSHKLSMHHCLPLIQLIKGKVNSWSARSLSYAGRLLLFNTVINGITNFWTSTFILPKECISKINSLCSSFLWHGYTEGSDSAKVSWETITLSKDEGGLGCRDLKAWNKACSIKLIWLLFKSPSSIWVAWFINEILGGNLSSLWTIKIKQHFPWFVKKILGHKDITYSWIKTNVGSGDAVRFGFITGPLLAPSLNSSRLSTPTPWEFLIMLRFRTSMTMVFGVSDLQDQNAKSQFKRFSPLLLWIQNQILHLGSLMVRLGINTA